MGLAISLLIGTIFLIVLGVILAIVFTKKSPTSEALPRPSPIIPASEVGPSSRVKYVRLFLDNAGENDGELPGSYINIRELEVIKDGTNIALSRSVTGTESYKTGNGVEYPITYINDGKLDNMYHSEKGTSHEVVIDLGNPIALPLEVVLYNRTDCCQERIRGAVVQLLDSNKNLLESKIVTDISDKIVIPFN